MAIYGLKKLNKIKNIKLTQHKYNLLPYVSFGLVAMAFVHYECGWLSLVALVPLFFYLNYAVKAKLVAKTIITHVGLAGTLGFLSIMSWSLQTSPDNWASVGGITSKIFLTFTWLSLTALFSAGIWLVAWLFAKFRPNLLSLRGVVLCIAFWLLGDFFRSLLFSIVAAGPGSVIGPNFHFGALGFAASVTPLVFAARLVGLYGLTALVLLCNFGVFWLLKKRWNGVLLIASPIVVAYGGYALYPLQKDKTVNVGVVQLGGWEGEGGYYEKLTEIAQQKQGEPLDVLVLPEHSNFYEQTADKAKDKAAQSAILEPLFQGKNGLVITSTSKLDDKTRTHNSILYRDVQGNTLSEQNKRFIVPIGEYVPYVHEFLLTITGNRATYNIHQATRAVTSGKQNEHPVGHNGVTYGALACSGAVAPDYYRNLSTQGAEILTNSASLPILTQASQYHQQSRQMARFIAVANAKPFVQSARAGHSWVIDANGNFIAETEHYNLDYFQTKVDTSSHTTVYSQ